MQDSFVNKPNAYLAQYSSYLYPKKSEKWLMNNTVTVKLNCNDWSVTFYQDGIIMEQKSIDKDTTYWFILKLCGGEGFTELQCVEPNI